MKISNKEKIMLCILGIIIIGFGYYNFVYLFQVSAIEVGIKQESEIKQKYDNAKNTIDSMEDRKSDVKILNAKIKEEVKPFYPTISEENIIVELDKLLKDSGLKGGITFQPIVSDSVENSKNESNSLAESSLQGIVDEYNNTFKDTEKSDDKTVNDSTNTKGTTNANGESGTSNTNDPQSSTDNGKKDSKEKKKNTVQYLKCEVKFEGSYNGIDKFLNAIGEREKKIVVNSIKISEDTLDTLKGTINLEIYSIPKINEDLENYLEWHLNNTYGKNVPFSKGAASGVIKSNKETSNFMISVKSIDSELPTIMMGKTGDSLRTTYVYADSNLEEKVEMILTQEGDKYYYKYKTAKWCFPANYDGLGAEFVPSSKNIVLDISSEARDNSDDTSAIKLKLVNNTNKLAEVNVSGDDSANPRVTIDGDGTNISINQK